MKTNKRLHIAAMLLAASCVAMAAGQPNILLIFPDQLQRDVLSCCGGPVQTPNIDRLAREGVVFTRGYVPGPPCCPSRSMLMMGDVSAAERPEIVQGMIQKHEEWCRAHVAPPAKPGFIKRDTYPQTPEGYGMWILDIRNP